MATVQARLEEAGDRIGAEHRLGERVAAWRAREYRLHVGCGASIVLVGILLGWIPVLLSGPRYWSTAAEALGGLLAVGVLVAFTPPYWRRYGLFQFEHGLALTRPAKMRRAKPPFCPATWLPWYPV